LIAIDAAKKKRVKLSGSYEDLMAEICIVLIELAIREEIAPEELMGNLAETFFGGIAELERMLTGEVEGVSS